MQNLFSKYNIPTQITSIVVSFPVGVENKIVLPKTLQTNIGLIFGLSIYCDTVTATNQTLITTTEAGLLYLILKQGSSDFIDGIRFDDMLFNFSGVPTLPANKYLPVHIPAPFSLDQSYIANPTGIVAPAAPATKAVQVNFWYVNMAYWKMIEKHYPELQQGARINEMSIKK